MDPKLPEVRPSQDIGEMQAQWRWGSRQLIGRKKILISSYKPTKHRIWACALFALAPHNLPLDPAVCVNGNVFAHYKWDLNF